MRITQRKRAAGVQNVRRTLDSAAGPLTGLNCHRIISNTERQLIRDPETLKSHLGTEMIKVASKLEKQT